MDNIPYVNNEPDSWLESTVKSFILCMIVYAVWLRCKVYPKWGLFLLACIVGGFLSLMHSDYGTSNLVWVFWGCVAAGFITIVRIFL